VCRNYSLAYLRHLFNCGEITVMRLATYHNVYFYLNMMRRMRDSIFKDGFLEWKKEFVRGLSQPLA
jgi:queuine tRNA-ribosyltransferase